MQLPSVVCGHRSPNQRATIQSREKKTTTTVLVCSWSDCIKSLVFRNATTATATRNAKIVGSECVCEREAERGRECVFTMPNSESGNNNNEMQWCGLVLFLYSFSKAPTERIRILTHSFVLTMSHLSRFNARSVPKIEFIFHHFGQLIKPSKSGFNWWSFNLYALICITGVWTSQIWRIGGVVCWRSGLVACKSKRSTGL